MSRPLRENLELAERDGATWVCCARCGHELSREGEDWRRRWVVEHLPPAHLGPHRELLEGRLELEEHYCPGCGVTLDAAIVVARGAASVAGRRPARRPANQSTAPQPMALDPRTTAMPDISWKEAQAALGEQADEACIEASEFIYSSPHVSVTPQIDDYAQQTFVSERSLLEAVQDLTHRVHSDFKYRPQSTSIGTPLADVMKHRRGVCQDFAHVMIGAVRSKRLAARYVSGYVRPGPKVEGAQASHAWVSVFFPGRGWMDFDPTNDLMVSDNHIALAWGRDYADVTPVKGISLGGGTPHFRQLSVSIRLLKDVARHHRQSLEDALSRSIGLVEVELDRVPPGRERFLPFPLAAFQIDKVPEKDRLPLEQVEAISADTSEAAMAKTPHVARAAHVARATEATAATMPAVLGHG